MNQKGKRPPVGVGAGNAAFGRRQTTALIVPTAPEKSQRAASALAQLSATFPVIAEYRPLAIGIHRALLAAMPGTSNKIIRRAIALHCGRRRYLEALVAGGPRYALDGEVCGSVTEPQREVAEARLDKAPAPCATRPILHLPLLRGGAS